MHQLYIQIRCVSALEIVVANRKLRLTRIHRVSGSAYSVLLSCKDPARPVLGGRFEVVECSVKYLAFWAASNRPSSTYCSCSKVEMQNSALSCFSATLIKH